MIAETFGYAEDNGAIRGPGRYQARPGPLSAG
jgi:hypothetical protein